jgi:hypothetical protein
MKKTFIWLAISIVFLSAGCAKQEKPAITIGPITLTAEEFESAYQKAKGPTSGLSGRKEFLDVLISRKLVLEEAEVLGLDKDPQFLESLQLFWEQSLLKLVLARKLNELSLICKVSDKEIEDYYQRHKDTDFQGKELKDVQDQIKTLLYRLKQQLELQRWTTSLRKRTRIVIDYDLLGIPKNK